MLLIFADDAGINVKRHMFTCENIQFSSSIHNKNTDKLGYNMWIATYVRRTYNVQICKIPLLPQKYFSFPFERREKILLSHTHTHIYTMKTWKLCKIMLHVHLQINVFKIRSPIEDEHIYNNTYLSLFRFRPVGCDCHWLASCHHVYWCAAHQWALKAPWHYSWGRPFRRQTHNSTPVH